MTTVPARGVMMMMTAAASDASSLAAESKLIRVTGTVEKAAELAVRLSCVGCALACAVHVARCTWRVARFWLFFAGCPVELFHM